MEGGGTKPAGEHIFFYGKGNENRELGTGFFVHKRIISAVKKVEFVSDRMSYIILRGRWCHIIVLAYRLLVGKLDGKITIGRPRRRWVDNITMDLGEVGWGHVDWIGLAKDRNRWRAVVNSVLNLRVP
jgi:hypothetical protein